MPKILLPIVMVLAWVGSAFGQYGELVGTWEWVMTEHPDGTVSSPATDGHREQFCFGPDYSFVHYVDEQVAVESSWGVTDILVGSCLFSSLGWGGDIWLWRVEGGVVRWLYLSDDFGCPPGGIETPAAVTRMTLVSRDAVPTDDRTWGAVKSLFR